jgi:hypothetical protein
LTQRPPTEAALCRAQEILIAVENIRGSFDHTAPQAFEHAVFVAAAILG